MKKSNAYFLLSLIIIAIIALSVISYQTGFKRSENDMGSLLMTMNIDSNFVTTGLYEELPNDVRKTMAFYIEDTPTVVKDVKIVAEVKYILVGEDEIEVDNGDIWNIIKRENVFQRKFDTDNSKPLMVPNSPFASILGSKLISTQF